MPTQIFEAPSFVLDWHQCNPPDPWMLGGVLKLHEFVTSPENLRAGRAGKCVYTSYLGEAEPTPAWARPLMSPLATLRQRLHGRWWIFPMAPPPPPADADDSWQLLHFRRAGTLYGIYLQFDYHSLFHCDLACVASAPNCFQGLVRREWVTQNTTNVTAIGTITGRSSAPTSGRISP
eukprot:TRINITY_DN60746_c0_g1_i2.p1 TRINITY_DN60746_c0_g1~~TRINITY_DN60746_c0_g1_i2.p1  ORF type:complete len:177 (+),score=9.69 TRINITY_DN60746_c0_g1_i2:38-568(+)